MITESLIISNEISDKLSELPTCTKNMVIKNPKPKGVSLCSKLWLWSKNVVINTPTANAPKTTSRCIFIKTAIIIKNRLIAILTS